MGRPPLVVWDVDARLDGNAVAPPQNLSPAVPWAVMHVQANVVSHMVGEQLVNVACSQVAEADALELVDQAAGRDSVDVLERESGGLAAEGDAGALHFKHGFVEVALGRGEFARGGPRPRNVGDVCAVLAAGVDEDELVVVEDVVVDCVVDAVGAGAAGHDGDVGRAVTAIDCEFVVEKGV